MRGWTRCMLNASWRDRCSSSWRMGQVTTVSLTRQIPDLFFRQNTHTFHQLLTVRALKSRLELQREDWTRRQLDLARERSGGEAPPPSGSASEGGPAGRVAGGGGPKGILGLLNS